MMLRNQCRARMQWLALVGILFAAGAMAQAQDGNAALTAPAGADDLREPRPQSDMTLLVDKDHLTTTSDRWIGVVCTPISDPLRAQLKLPVGQGMLVREVVPDSPAAKAGLQRNDVVLTANGKPLGSNAALVNAVHAAGDGGLELKILRGGVAKTISVQPAQRLKDRPGFRVPLGDEFKVQIWDATGAPDGRLQMRRIAPGFSVWTAAKPLPDNVSITIKKEGGKPAHITVERGDKKWEVTGDQLDELPPEVRGYILSLAHGITGANISVALPEQFERRFSKGLDAVKEGRRRGVEIRERLRRVPEAFEQRLKKLEQQMNKLMEQYRQQSAEATESVDQ